MKIILFIVVLSLFGCSNPIIIKEPTTKQKVQRMRDRHTRAFIQFAKQHREFQVDYNLRYMDSSNIMLLVLYSVSDSKLFVLLDKGDISLYIFLLSWEIKHSKDKYHWSWYNMLKVFFGYNFNEIESFDD